MSDKRRLFGVVGAEELHRDIAEAYESQVEHHICPDERVEIEEWTAADNRTFMPPVEDVINFVSESAADEAVTEWWRESHQSVLGSSEVKEAFQKAIDLVASKMTYWMAHKKVASHSVTLDANGEALIDGGYLYRKTESGGPQ